ncbi:hypothetical protein [Desulfonatronum thioautotrophicum]|uniref:hypothetical protein n=1 Tax=Desulfonatronum thioautotrophicum TaxID=617001 RepID=UPI00129471EB|nr:hypothetical protein [Desulfonatronum thioautotrophicum]
MPFPSRFHNLKSLSLPIVTALFATLLLSILAGLPVPAQGQENGPGNIPRQGPPMDGPRAGIDLQGFHLFNAHLENDQGKVAVTQTRADASWSRFTLGWHSNWYSWQDNNALPFGDGLSAPWDSLHVLTLMANHRDSFSPRWSYFIQGAIRSGFEKELSRSVGLAANAGLVYAWNPDWTVGIGGFIGVDPTSKFAFSSTFAMGGPFIQYRHPRAPGISGRLAFPQSELRYTGSPLWSTWLGLGVNSDTYRLADNSPVMPRGYLRERMTTAGLYVDVTPTPGMLLRLGPTYNFSRRMEFFDSSGGKRRSHELDTTLGVEAKISWSF